VEIRPNVAGAFGAHNSSLVSFGRHRLAGPVEGPDHDPVVPRWCGLYGSDQGTAIVSRRQTAARRHAILVQGLMSVAPSTSEMLLKPFKSLAARKMHFCSPLLDQGEVRRWLIVLILSRVSRRNCSRPWTRPCIARDLLRGQLVDQFVEWALPESKNESGRVDVEFSRFTTCINTAPCSAVEASSRAKCGRHGRGTEHVELLKITARRSPRHWRNRRQ
jgi:hypothetical protein